MTEATMGLEFFKRKGIDQGTLDVFKVGAGDTALSFPYPGGATKIRRGPPAFRDFCAEGVPGVYPLIDPIGAAEVAIVVEGETDALKLWQELRDQDAPTDVYGLSGVNNVAALDRLDMSRYKVVFFVLDNDDGNAAYGMVNNAAAKLSMRGYTQVVLPADVNDVCDFFKFYNLDSFNQLLNQSLEVAKQGQLHFEALDLHSPIPDPDWLLPGLICKGDIVIVGADMNTGKSMWTTALAVAMAEGHPKFLGFDLRAHGKALIVDKENPQDEVRRRLEAFSTNGQYKDNVRYLSHQPVSLDRYVDKLHDEVRFFKPELVVLDALTRFHNQDENSAGAMAKLLNDGVAPLSREYGATVILIHHTAKDQGAGSSNLRGSTDLRNFPDTGILLRKGGDAGPQDAGVVYLDHFKNRRGKEFQNFPMRLVDTDTGMTWTRTEFHF